MKKIFIIFLLVFGYASLFAQYQSGIRVEDLLKTDSTVIGQKINFNTISNSEITISKVIIPPGKSTGWHKHDIHVFAYVLQGTLTVEVEGRETKTYTKEASFAEVVDTYHNGYNAGSEDVVLIAFYLGEKDKPLSKKKL